MDIFQHYSPAYFLELFPDIKKNIDEWYIVDVHLTEKTRHNTSYIALSLKKYFSDKKGAMFTCSRNSVLVLVRMGRNISSSELISDIHERLPKHSCEVQASDITPEGLVKIQLRLEAIEQDNEFKSQGLRLLKMRQDRSERVVMVVDDDAFMRALVNHTFRTRSRVIGIAKASEVLNAYFKYLPDIVFLDIHLPGISGMEVLKEILSVDDSAYVVMCSLDSVQDNIIRAGEIGAKGFIAKPFTLDTLEACYKKCPTVQNQYH